MIFTVGSAGLAAVKNTYFSGGISSWFGGGEVQPLNPQLADANFEPIAGEPVPVLKEAQGFSLLTSDQSPAEPFASFGPISKEMLGDTNKTIIEEVLKEGATSAFPPVDPLTQTPPVGVFNMSNISQPEFPSYPTGPQMLPPDLSAGLPGANLSNVNVNVSTPNVSSVLNTTIPLDLNITETPPTNITPPSNVTFTEASQGWLESVASYDYSSALTNPYNYLSAMTTYFTLSNIKAAYDNTGILGAVKQGTKEVVKRAVSVYAAEAISEGVATYFNPENPIQKEATKQNVKDVIAVTVGVVMPLVSFGMSKYQANKAAKNQAERIRQEIETERQENLAIEYATALFRADSDLDLATINVPIDLDLTVANTMLQEEQRQRTFSHDFAKIISKLPDINFDTVKKHIPEGIDFERAMLILMSEKEKRKKIVVPDVKAEKVIKQAADVTPPPTTYTPSNTAGANKPVINPEAEAWERAYKARIDKR